MEFGKEYREYDVGLGGMENSVLHHLNQKFQSPEQKFSYSLNLTFRLVQTFFPEFNSSYESDLQKFALKMPNMPYKNTTAFVLGCIAASNPDSDCEFKRRNLNRVFNILPSMSEDDSVTKSDIIRYGVFAMKNNFNIGF